MLRRFLIYFTSFCLLFGGLAAGFSWHFYQSYLDRPLALDEREFILRVPDNSSLTTVTRELGVDGYLQYPRLLRLHARLQDTQSIRAGEYRLVAGDTPRILLDKLHRGDVLLYRVSLIEGWTTAQMLAHLRSDGRLQDDLGNIRVEDLPLRLKLDVDNAEGWFYPDTYVFARNMPLSMLLQQAHRRMQTVLDEEWQNRSFGLPYDTPYEALIMASIVEKETGTPTERAEIAGVFIRRLQHGMRLQTDPTVIYGLADQYKGNLTRAHLQQPTPYNTYTNSGLPPTPIANPGRAAIHAALNPDDGDSLYFVARGDGSHQFSETLEDHNAAVRQYQIEQRSGNYQSTPKGGQ